MTDTSVDVTPINWRVDSTAAGVNDAMHAQVAELLGREPRGLLRVPVLRRDGSPVVIRVASLVDDEPFPTLFWLVDAALNYRLDGLEAMGAIAQLQAEVDESAELQAAMRDDHARYIALRNRFMCTATRDVLERKGYFEALASRGVGGLHNLTRIRCLHTWYAAHLVVPNAVGRLAEQHFPAILEGC